MRIHKRRNKQGFTYIVAIGILGLLAFMGLFLMQSSSTEYSQTSLSVYRTMGRQLAEAAADEACVFLEERFKDKTSNGAFQKLLWQASTSGPMRTGGQTGKNPTLLDDFSDLANYVSQTDALRKYHVSRAGFSIDKIIPTIKDMRPIPNGPLDYDTSTYRPTDREKPYDNEWSKDWYCTLQIDVTLSLEKHHKTSINYKLCKDIKLLNLGPMARNYSFFSIIGQQITSNDSATVQSALRTGLNLPDKAAGRLFLWNVPFQSRVYMHGPAIIQLENPVLATDRQYYGGYNVYGEKNSRPGINQAFQYSDSFYGMSYFPTVSRCLFPSKNFSGLFSSWSPTPTEEDSVANATNYAGLFKKDTVMGGLLPEKDKGFWSRIGDGVQEGCTDNYFTGTNVHQKFMPAGPFCRTPWRYVAPNPDSSSPSWANIKAAPTMAFPETDDKLRLEHRWNPDDDSVAESTQIISRVYAMKYNHFSGELNGGDAPEEEMAEFSLSYYNDPDPEGFLAKLGSSVASLGKGLWNVITLPAQAFGNLLGKVFGGIIGGGDASLNANEETQFMNLYPTNFKHNYQRNVTRRLKDETEIPKDSQGRWILNGVYWVNQLKIEAPITYIGTGTLMVCQYKEGEPLTIKGDVIAARENGVPQGHMNIFYHPYTSQNLSDVTDRMLRIEGSVFIEASVYSCYGIRVINDSGNIQDADFATKAGMNPNEPTDTWTGAQQYLKDNCTVIYGNYVNFYMNLNKQNDDLWVIHNYTNPYYFEPFNGGCIITQDLLDTDANKRLAFETLTHEFFMSPKIQHIGIKGAL